MLELRTPGILGTLRTLGTLQEHWNFGNTRNTGNTRNIGNTRNTGSTGNTRNTRNTGSTGNTRNTGNSGNMGNSRNTGNTGNTRNTGNTGNCGIIAELANFETIYTKYQPDSAVSILFRYFIACFCFLVFRLFSNSYIFFASSTSIPVLPTSWWEIVIFWEELELLYG